jgi:hypothetical protein
MAANTTTRARVVKRFTDLNVPMASGVTALYRGNFVGSVPLTHTCAEMGHVANMQALGYVKEDRPGVDNIGGTAYPVPIRLTNPIEVEYLANGTGTEMVLATDFMRVVYYKDDHTFTLAANNGSGLNYQKAGRLIDVDPLLGAGVWKQDWISGVTDAAMIS